MSEKPPSGAKKTGKKGKKGSSSSPKTPKSRKSSEPSSPRPDPAPVPRLPISSKICSIHHKELNLYSETKEELLCEDCSNSLVHSRYPSKLLKVEEAFRIRLSGLYNLLNNYVLPKKDQISKQKKKVESCLSSAKAKKGEIEKDMKGEFSAMNERLNFSYGTKQAVLQHEQRELQVDLDRIQHIINIIESSANEQVTFLQRSGDLKNLIELSLTKPVRADVQVSSADMPKELNKVREMVTDFSALKNLISIKDEIIWKLVHEKPKTKEINEAVSREMAEWARLAEKYTQELKKFQVNCEYCGCPLGEETVNSNCPKNIRGENRGKLAGTGRHYFSDGVKQGVRSSSPATKDTEVSIKDVSRLVKQKKIPLHKIFLQDDPNRTGNLKIQDFVEVVQNVLELSKVQAQGIAVKYDKGKNGLVAYEKFVKHVGEEAVRENKKEILEEFRGVDQELDGVVSVEGFLGVLDRFGVILENPKVFKNLQIDENGNLEYLVFINDVVKKRRS